MSDERDFLTGYVLPAARVASREIAAALSPLGLAPAQYAVLDLLGREGDMRPAQIARRLDIETSTTTNTLNRTEKGGWIERRTDPNNSRMVVISLSPKGKAILADARAAVHSVEFRVADAEYEADLKSAREILKKVIMELR